MDDLKHLSKKARRRELAKMKREPAHKEEEHNTSEHEHKTEHKAEHKHYKKEKGLMGSIKYIYDTQYKKLLLIPIIIFILAIAQIGFQTATTGDFVSKATSIKGGQTITILTEQEVDTLSLKEKLASAYPDYDVDVRTLTSSGSASGIIVDADFSDKTDTAPVIELFSEQTGTPIENVEYSINMIGSSLGESFFRETFFAILIAFLFMGIVVFLYFRLFVPSMALIWCALGDIMVTLAVFNLLGFKLSTAGIAAFLMLIGYSVDTDILLSTRVLKRKEGTVTESIHSSVKTGMTMTITTIAAVTVGLIVAKSDVMQQIMTILLIGLCVDLINTWLQNTALLKWYLEKKGKKV